MPCPALLNSRPEKTMTWMHVSRRVGVCYVLFLLVLCFSAEVERDLIPLAQHAPQKFGDKLKTLVQLIGVFCRLLRSSIKVPTIFFLS